MGVIAATAAPRIRSELIAIIHQVRRRWRMKLALRGALGVLGLGVSSCCCRRTASSRGASAPASIITFRVILGVALAGLVAYSSSGR